jgi:hypothetical protein
VNDTRTPATFPASAEADNVFDARRVLCELEVLSLCTAGESDVAAHRRKADAARSHDNFASNRVGRQGDGVGAIDLCIRADTQSKGRDDDVRAGNSIPGRVSYAAGDHCLGLCTRRSRKRCDESKAGGEQPSDSSDADHENLKFGIVVGSVRLVAERPIVELSCVAAIHPSSETRGPCQRTGRRRSRFPGAELSMTYFCHGIPPLGVWIPAPRLQRVRRIVAGEYAILRRACGRAANIDNDFTSYNTSEVIDPVITEDIRGGAESGLLRAM